MRGRAAIILVLTVWASALGAIRASAAVPKVMLVGIDGCRADAAEKVASTAFAGILDGAAVSFSAQNLPLRIVDAETSSGPSWASVLSGAFPDKHGWLDDVRRRRFNGRFPHFLARLEAARPSSSTVSVVTWPDIMEMSAAADISEKAASDQDAEDKALLHVSRGGADAIFVHLDHVDHTGHGKGFSPDNADYLAAIEETGKRVVRLVEAVRKRSAEHPDEDWLVIITSDHGGHGNGHNSHRHVVPDIRKVPFIVIGRAADPKAIDGQVYTVDAAATALVHLGLPLDAAWELDGVPVGLAGHPAPATSRPNEPAATVFIPRPK